MSTLWTKRLEIARRNLRRMANTPGIPDAMLVPQAKLFIESYYRGPWKMIFSLTKGELKSLWMRRGWSKWERFRTKVLRRDPDPALLVGQRVEEEEDELKKLTDDL